MKSFKKILAVLLTFIMVMLFAACGNSSSDEEITSLVGNWEAVEFGETYQAGYITEDKIEIFWISDDGDTVYLYWSGSYEDPEEATTSYSWDSVNDTSRTSSAILASDAETKTFTYENGVLSYSVTALGTTTTQELVMTDTDYSVYGESDSDDEETEEETEEEEETEAEIDLDEYEYFTYDELDTGEYVQQNFCIDVIVDRIYIEYDESDDDYDGSYVLWYATGDTYTCDIQFYGHSVTSEELQYIFMSAQDGDVIRYYSTTYNDGSFGTSNMVAAEIIDSVDIETVYENVRSNYPSISTMYEDIQRNPDNYRSDNSVHCYVSGTIYLVIDEDSTSAEYLLSTSDGYVYVNWYESSDTRGSNLLVGDNITVYGETSGTDDYATAWGDNASPSITAYFVDLN